MVGSALTALHRQSAPISRAVERQTPAAATARRRRRRRPSFAAPPHACSLGTLAAAMPPGSDAPDFSSWRVGELRRYLHERGVSTAGAHLNVWEGLLGTAGSCEGAAGFSPALGSAGGNGIITRIMCLSHAC